MKIYVFIYTYIIYQGAAGQGDGAEHESHSGDYQTLRHLQRGNLFDVERRKIFICFMFQSLISSSRQH